MSKVIKLAFVIDDSLPTDGMYDTSNVKVLDIAQLENLGNGYLLIQTEKFDDRCLKGLRFSDSDLRYVTTQCENRLEARKNYHEFLEKSSNQ